jgi:preprotein translocase subunit SecE
MAREADLGRSAPRPQPRVAGEVSEGGRGGNVLQRLWRFVNEAVAELKKVEWPGQNQVIQGTVVVLVACAIVGLYLWLNDQVWKHFVSKVLLGQ